METDRWAILTLRAAARGVVDFGRCDPLSKRWWDRITRVLNALAREDNIQVYDAALRYHLALLGSPFVAEDKASDIMAAAQETMRDLLAAVQPWMKQDKASAQDQTINALVAAYKEKCGDPNDPEFMQRLRHDIALRAAEREKKRNKPIGQDKLLQQRLAERDRRRTQSQVRKPLRGRT